MWDCGYYKGLRYCVKHYDEPSAEFGLNGSRISKCEIRRGDTVTFNYDRGEDIPATDTETKDTLDYLMTVFG